MADERRTSWLDYPSHLGNQAIPVSDAFGDVLAHDTIAAAIRRHDFTGRPPTLASK